MITKVLENDGLGSTYKATMTSELCVRVKKIKEMDKEGREASHVKRAVRED